MLVFAGWQHFFCIEEIKYAFVYILNLLNFLAFLKFLNDFSNTRTMEWVALASAVDFASNHSVECFVNSIERNDDDVFSRFLSSSLDSINSTECFIVVLAEHNVDGRICFEE